MTEIKKESRTDHNAIRIGVILEPLGDINLSALRYLILHLNTLQGSFEYEILPVNSDDPFIKQLASKTAVDRQKVKREIPAFLHRNGEFLQQRIAKFGLQEPPPNHFIIVSTAWFSDNHYVTNTEGLSILALRNWKRSMAPPSIVEFIVTLILRSSVSVACPSLRKSVHLGTKGCLFDFTAHLDEVRYKVLNGFICKHCSTALANEGLHQMRDDLLHVLRKEWLGVPDDPDSPSGIMAKLGYDLFLTRGLKPTPWETFMATIRQEGAKELIKIVGGILLAGLLVWLGLNAG